MRPNREIKVIRVLGEKTQRELAQMIGVTQSAISRIESGEIRLSPERKSKILRCLLERRER
jgi:predicted transcriptional regulator